jgi:hypothetical protein
MEDLSVNSGVCSLAQKLLDDFNTRWGSGNADTVFDEHRTLGPRQRVIGVSLAALLGAALDPRTKSLAFLSEGDRRKITSAIKAKALSLAGQTEVNPSTAPAMDGRSDDLQNPDDLDFNAFDPMLFGMPPTNARDLAADPSPTCLEEQIDLELRLFQMEPGLPLGKPAETCNKALAWWKVNETKFPMLAALARRVLAIPATSASCERIFSRAGLTVSDLRASLLPDIAEVLVLMHDYWNDPFF